MARLKVLDVLALLNWNLLFLRRYAGIVPLLRGFARPKLHLQLRTQSDSVPPWTPRFQNYESKRKCGLNDDATIDSICPRCFVIVGHCLQEADFEKAEQSHVCNSWRVEHYRGLSKALKEYRKGKGDRAPVN